MCSNRFVPVVLILALSLAACTRKSSTFGSGLPKVAATQQEASLERQMFERLNRDRGERGLSKLSFDERLADIARYHSKDMRDAGFFGHDSPTTGSPQDRINRSGYLVAESRENVAQAPDVTTAQDQLLKSPGHYANIVATSITHVGIGVVRDKEVPGQVRGYYFTQLFASPVKSQSPQDVRDVVMAKIRGARERAGMSALVMHPLLERFAKEHVTRIDPNRPDHGLDSIGDAIVKQLGNERGHDLRSVESAAQVGLDPAMFKPEDLLDNQVRAIGFSVTNDKDAQGKPVFKMLFIVGR